MDSVRCLQRWLLAASVCISAVACDDSSATPTSPEIVLRDANNYRSSATLTIPVVETAAEDFEICWGAITHDIRCHELMPTTAIDAVGLVRISGLSSSEVEQALANDSLESRSISGYIDYKADHESTCIQASAMTLFGTEVDFGEVYVESEDSSYLLVFNEGTAPGVGARTMTFVRPSASSTNLRVDAPASGCDILEFDADLTALEAVPVPRAGPWIIDWSEMTTNGQGNPFVHQDIDQVLVAFYEGMTVADLEARILDLELLATRLWELPLLGGRTADLAEATLRGGSERFGGFETARAGTWVLGLSCTTCQNPAPVMLTLLQPEGS